MPVVSWNNVFAKMLVELDGDIAGKFHMLLLVLAHGHDVSAEHQNVSIHEARVAIETHVHVGIRVLASGFVLGHLVLVGVGAVHESLRRKAAECPTQFKDLGNVALLVEQALFGVQAKGKPGGRNLVDVGTHLGAVLHRGESMVVGDKVDRIVGLGKFKSGADSTQVVTQVRSAGGLDARKGNFLHGRKGSIFYLGHL